MSVVFNSLNNVLGLMSCKRSSENGQVLVGFVLEDAYIEVYGDFDPGSGCPHLIEKDGHRGQVVVAVRNTLTADQQAFAEFHGGLTGPRRDPVGLPKLVGRRRGLAKWSAAFIRMKASWLHPERLLPKFHRDALRRFFTPTLLPATSL